MSDEKVSMVVPSLEELSPFVRFSLEKVARHEGFTDFSLEIEPGANIGDGFVGIMLKVQIKGTKNTQKSELNVLCKIPPMNKARREQFNSIEIFSREIEMYNVVLPHLKKFQESKGIREDEGFFNYPKCYFAGESKELDDAVVIMEDLRDKGYGMADKFVSIDFPHAKLVMEGLGRLHALSFALKVQEPETLKQWQFKDVLTEMMHREEFIEMFERYFDQAMEALKPEETDVKEKMEHYKKHITEELNFLTSAEEAEPYTVLNHGDCWINNFLFHRNSSNIPTDIKFIDYQISRYVSPVLDIVYFIFASTDKAFRDQHYDELIRIYHASFTKFLKRLGEDPEELFSFDDLQKQLKKFGRFGMPMALMLLPIITTQSKDLPDFDKLPELMEEFKKGDQMSDEAKEFMELSRQNALRVGGRTREVAIDMVRLGYM